MTENLDKFEPKWFSPPGDTILDILEEKNWTQAEFANRTGYTRKHVSQLISGKATITEEAALRLEKVLGSSAAFWLSREAQYREVLARTEERSHLENQVDWLKDLPLKHMIKYKWIRKFPEKADQVSECLKFFGVASVSAWRSRYTNPENLAVFRSSPKFQKKVGAVAAWLRQGERLAEQHPCEQYDRKAFRAKLGELRRLTNEPDPEIFRLKLIKACATVGVVVVFEPAPQGCPATGATRWVAPDKALIMLSLRYRTNDHLWFAFFHEAAHILFHGKKMLFLELESHVTNGMEQEANQFASDFLIPKEKASKLRFIPHTNKAVKAFADELEIAPGIVVGRMQHDKLLKMNYLNGLKVRYKWKTD